MRARPSPQLVPIPDKRTVLLVFMLSGLAGLVYEVVWARQLVLVFGNTTQALSAILTGFFGGMALGSVLGGRLADRVRSPLRMYPILELLMVAGVLITPVAFGGLREIYRGAFGAQFYAQTVSEIRSHVGTFRSVFPHVTLVFSQGMGLFMLGSDKPIDLGPAGIQAVLSRPGVLDDLRSAPRLPGRRRIRGRVAGLHPRPRLDLGRRGR